MSEGPKPSKWLAKAMSAVVVVLAVAVGARVAWALLAPLVPMLLVITTLGLVYAMVFGKFRK
jgi:hypothetical protein